MSIPTLSELLPELLSHRDTQWLKSYSLSIDLPTLENAVSDYAHRIFFQSYLDVESLPIENFRCLQLQTRAIARAFPDNDQLCLLADKVYRCFQLKISEPIYGNQGQLIGNDSIERNMLDLVQLSPVFQHMFHFHLDHAFSSEQGKKMILNTDHLPEGLKYYRIILDQLQGTSTNEPLSSNELINLVYLSDYLVLPALKQQFSALLVENIGTNKTDQQEALFHLVQFNALSQSQLNWAQNILTRVAKEDAELYIHILDNIRIQYPPQMFTYLALTSQYNINDGRLISGLETLVKEAYTPALFERGKNLIYSMEKRKHRRGLHLLKKAALDKYTPALQLLLTIEKRGKIKSLPLKIRLLCYQHQVKQGHTHYLEKLGLVYECISPKRLDLAFKCFSKAPKSTLIQLKLAKYHTLGLGRAPVKLERAQRILKPLAKRKNAQALYLLAQTYKKTNRFNNFQRYLKQAALLNYPKACLDYAHLLKKTLPYEHSDVAKRWFSKATKLRYGGKIPAV